MFSAMFVCPQGEVTWCIRPHHTGAPSKGPWPCPSCAGSWPQTLLYRTLALCPPCTGQWYQPPPQPSGQDPSPGSLCKFKLLQLRPHCTDPLDMFKLVPLRPHCTGYKYPLNLFKLVHYEAHTVCKWVVGIILNAFLLIVSLKLVWAAKRFHTKNYGMLWKHNSCKGYENVKQCCW